MKRLVTLAVAIVGGASLLTGCGGSATSAEALAPATTSAPTTTAPPTTTTTRPLPQPTPPPANPYADVPITQIGTITIPRIGLSHAIFNGVWLTVVDNGPGHWPGSAMPGRIGNSVFAGHRVTHTRPFYDVDLLVAGDKIVFDMSYGVFTYAVTKIITVKPDDLWITDPTRGPTLTLFACHPKHSAAERIVVKGKLVGSKLKPKVSQA